MKENYDFSRGVKNPYAEILKSGYTVMVHHDFSENGNCKEEADDLKVNGKERPDMHRIGQALK